MRGRTGKLALLADMFSGEGSYKSKGHRCHREGKAEITRPGVDSEHGTPLAPETCNTTHILCYFLLSYHKATKEGGGGGDTKEKLPSRD